MIGKAPAASGAIFTAFASVVNTFLKNMKVGTSKANIKMAKLCKYWNEGSISKLAGMKEGKFNRVRMELRCACRFAMVDERVGVRYDECNWNFI